MKKFNRPEYIESPGWALGTYFGLSDLWGDVGSPTVLDRYTNSIYLAHLHFMGGIYTRYNFHPAFALRLSLSYGTVYSSDAFNRKKALSAIDPTDEYLFRYLRNQDAKTNIWEGSLLMELSPFRFFNAPIAYRLTQPYFLVGVGGFHFKQKSLYTNRITGNSKYIDTYNLHLEGDGFTDMLNAPKKLSRWQMCIPLGGGIRWDIGQQLNLGIEYLYRITFTDYLDGVSNTYIDPTEFDKNLSPNDALIAKDMYDKQWQITGTNHSVGTKRGNGATMDAYSTLSLTFYYKLKNRRNPWWEPLD